MLLLLLQYYLSLFSEKCFLTCLEHFQPLLLPFLSVCDEWSVRPMGRKAYLDFLYPRFSASGNHWRVSHPVFLSYTLASRRLVPYLASYALFQVLHSLQRGYGQPARRSHTLLSRLGTFPEGTANAFGFTYPCPSLKSSLNL